MKKQKKVSTKTAPTKKDEKTLTTTAESNEIRFSPVFVEVEKMFDRFSYLNWEIGHKAFELFLKRGGEFGKEFEDWLQAESEVLLSIPVEITENNDKFDVRATITGFKPEEIEVSVKDNLVFLSGKTEIGEEREYEDGVYNQWHSNRFFRALPLSSEVDADNVKANLKDGVLQLTLQKMPPREPKHIAVNVA
jgi:HSP20 family protein